jgi:uncharacterized protein YjiS (DUF1127 family)
MQTRSIAMSSFAQRRAAARLPRESESLVARIRRALVAWHRRACSRAQLAQLDDRALRDIGLTRAEAAMECAKPFWRA